MPRRPLSVGARLNASISGFASSSDLRTVSTAIADATSPAAWNTVDLSSKAALTATTGGWKNTNEIGIYPKPFFRVLERPTAQIVERVRPGYYAEHHLVNPLGEKVAVR